MVWDLNEMVWNGIFLGYPIPLIPYHRNQASKCGFQCAMRILLQLY